MRQLNRADLPVRALEAPVEKERPPGGLMPDCARQGHKNSFPENVLACFGDAAGLTSQENASVDEPLMTGDRRAGEKGLANFRAIPI